MKLLIIFSFMFSSSVNALSLKESWQGAKKNMEMLKIAEQEVIQREEQTSRLKSALLPHVSGFAQYTQIDPPDIRGLNVFTLTRQHSVGVRLTQPLFRASALGALQVARENILLAQYQKDSTGLLLYQLVIEAYFNLKMAQLDNENLTQLLSYGEERVREIRSRTKIGRSRKGELVEAQAQLYISQSQYQQGLNVLKESEKNFEYLTQLKPTKLSPLETLKPKLGQMDEYLTKLNTRPDILAAHQQVKIADQEIKVSQGGHFPTLDLVSNYYVDRTGVLASSQWDAGVVLTIPLYQGGGVESSVRESISAKHKTELAAHEKIRSAQRDLTILYQNYHQILNQLKTLKKALKKSQEAYQLNKKDYQFGLVTNLDVLQSLNSYIQTKRTFDSLTVMAHSNFYQFQAASGELP